MTVTSLSEFNRTSREFWQRENQLLEKRMANPLVRETAHDRIEAELTIGLPVFFQTSLYKALEDAERAGQRFLSEHARKGGRAPKGDNLQKLIDRIVQKSPHITAPQLEAKLRVMQVSDCIQEIDERTIWFTVSEDRTKTAKISGLKDRLSRAKKARSR